MTVRNRTRTNKFKGWDEVRRLLDELADAQSTSGNPWLNPGQCASIRRIGEMLCDNGVLLADEVGLGKTRVAVAVVNAVMTAGGRTAILLPPILGNQWGKELSEGFRGIGNQDSSVPPLLRNLRNYAEKGAAAEKQETNWLQNEPVLMLSHGFTNWRLGETRSAWRWAMLPLLYGEWRMRQGQRSPKGFGGFTNAFTDAQSLFYGISRVACRTADVLRGLPLRSEMRKRADEIMDAVRWPEVSTSRHYEKHAIYRPLLERAVGLGLGAFDLIVIDEAHKGRGQSSMLNSLLDNVILPSRQARRLGMTATPVELDSKDWQGTLARVGIPELELEAISMAVKGFVEAAEAVRQRWRSDPDAREHYQEMAGRFQKVLSSYVIRRDKRGEEDILLFQKVMKESADSYRITSESRISWSEVGPNWRQAICAAEALSQVSAGRRKDGSGDLISLQRSRLTIGNGHSIASIMDAVSEPPDRLAQAPGRSVKDDGASRQDDDDIEDFSYQVSSVREISDSKRASRISWWVGLMRQQAASSSPREGSGARSVHAYLYEHPALRKAVELIEQYTQRGEKILVFAKYTKPMHALAQLLNARAMIRSLQQQQGWPLSHVPAMEPHDERPAVLAALTQLGSPWTLEDVNRHLEEQRRELSPVERVEEALTLLKKPSGSEVSLDFDPGVLAERLRVIRESDELQEDMVARLGLAIEAFLEPAIAPLGSEAEALRYAEALSRVIATLDLPVDAGEADDDQDTVFLERLKLYLHDEYSTRRSSYAQILDGGTKIDTRRIRQAAFNRSGIFPRVLVAQSTVAREGLNLHEACRVVVMLHPEWNPAVAEQQVGRVDRVNSRWARSFQAWCHSSKDQPAPRIEIHHIIFEGTYDEHHWSVLNQRWDDLRSQLHGVVVPQRERENCDENERQLIEVLDAASPDFTPRP